jgi:predicted DNA-binding transcriptional regulator AlpA
MKMETFSTELTGDLAAAFFGTRTPSLFQERLGHRQELLTAEQLATKLAVNVGWIKRHSRGSNCLPHVRLGKMYRYRTQEVLEWLKRKAAPRG